MCAAPQLQDNGISKYSPRLVRSVQLQEPSAAAAAVLETPKADTRRPERQQQQHEEQQSYRELQLTERSSESGSHGERTKRAADVDHPPKSLPKNNGRVGAKKTSQTSAAVAALGGNEKRERALWNTTTSEDELQDEHEAFFGGWE
jgi:hypothetical protein